MWKLIGMVVIGLISAILSYYNKNYYVRLFNDIWGKEEEVDSAARTGRGFFYGFFFPLYFGLAVMGLVGLIVFLVAAGIAAAVIFVITWVTEKILPNAFIGGFILSLMEKVGLKKPVLPPTSMGDKS